MNIHQIFERNARQYPDAIALVWLDEKLTYQQLDARANFLARHLVTEGVNPGAVVGLDMPRSVEMIVAMLAVLKCRAAYYPMDNANPVPRTLSCLETADVEVIVGPPGCNEALLENRTLISTQDKALFNSSLEVFSVDSVDVQDCAYVMFTSGSTGTPKGVSVPHRAVTRLVIDANYINITPADNILQFAPLSFDASTFEIWGALLNGGTLVLYSGLVLDPNLFKKEILENDVSILWLTAALFHLIASNYIEALQPLKVLLAGGDVLNAQIVNKVIDSIPGIRVINGYGPTENTTFTCCHVMTADNKPGNHVPIGRAISGTEAHILDENDAPVSTGEIGELIVSGQGVALGYLKATKKLDGAQNKPEFFYDSSIAEGLLYRTGDLVKANDVGELDFIGRKDNQVKVRGYRVSLEEIKTRIADLKGVNDAVVLRHSPSSGDQILIAFVLKQSDDDLDEKSVRAHLRGTLPNYMIPNQFVFDTSLPITKNGKLDRKALAKDYLD